MSTRQRGRQRGMPRRVFTPLTRVGETQELAESLTIENVAAPDAASPGDVVTLVATVTCQTVPFGVCEAAVRFSSNGQEVRVPRGDWTNINEAGQDKFSAQLEMPPSGNLTVTVEALELGTVGRVNVEDRSEVTIQSISEQEKRQRQAFGYAPWVIGGGAIGAGGARFTNRSPVAGAAIGVGAGVAAKTLTSEVGLPEFGGVDFPTVPVLATAGLLGAGAFLLTQLPDVDFPGGVTRRARAAVPSS